MGLSKAPWRSCLLFLVVMMTLQESRCSFDVQSTDCAKISTNRICYMCALRQGSNLVFRECCQNANDMRDYCKRIYTEPPRVGGLWID
ncbi:sodium-influx-stimulating peptide-like [Biomphalaria glabrata]|uniref:Sodium-influx-stimulating peptide-like n=1 Tax=Biomphalaria glabrata TaxID=6526 RepID=A0A9W3A1P9_BIOGL|nr:sodium-influx-stimulating peptide-like [Biomphalaria glabrata]KAI8741671.1 Sodium-influx-stimulating peptide [Biomphalaria glabrata]